jgi:hypothetical protein
MLMLAASEHIFVLESAQLIACKLKLSMASFSQPQNMSGDRLTTSYRPFQGHLGNSYRSANCQLGTSSRQIELPSQLVAISQ